MGIEHVAAFVSQTQLGNGIQRSTGVNPPAGPKPEVNSAPSAFKQGIKFSDVTMPGHSGIKSSVENSSSSGASKPEVNSAPSEFKKGISIGDIDKQLGKKTFDQGTSRPYDGPPLGEQPNSEDGKTLLKSD